VAPEAVVVVDVDARVVVVVVLVRVLEDEVVLFVLLVVVEVGRVEVLEVRVEELELVGRVVDEVEVGVAEPPEQVGTHGLGPGGR
jgi:hypothetical protein